MPRPDFKLAAPHFVETRGSFHCMPDSSGHPQLVLQPHDQRLTIGYLCSRPSGAVHIVWHLAPASPQRVVPEGAPKEMEAFFCCLASGLVFQPPPLPQEGEAGLVLKGLTRQTRAVGHHGWQGRLQCLVLWGVCPPGHFRVPNNQANFPLKITHFRTSGTKDPGECDSTTHQTPPGGVALRFRFTQTQDTFQNF